MEVFSLNDSARKMAMNKLNWLRFGISLLIIVAFSITSLTGRAATDTYPFYLLFYYLLLFSSPTREPGAGLAASYRATTY